jgi:hypothetical protein
MSHQTSSPFHPFVSHFLIFQLAAIPLACLSYIAKVGARFAGTRAIPVVHQICVAQPLTLIATAKVSVVLVKRFGINN